MRIGAVGCVIMLLLVLTSGCLDAGRPGDTDGEDPLTPSPNDEQKTRAVVHRPLSDEPNQTDEETAELLPGIPLPMGGSRYTGGHGFEPTLGVTQEGVLFMSSLLASASPYDEVTLLRSRDQGLSWDDVTPRIVDPVAFNPLSFDPYTHVDFDTGRVFDSQLGALACATLAISDDEGESWILNPVGCGHPVAPHDHQTIWTGPPRVIPPTVYPNVVYYCVNRLVDSACAVSANGGLTFGPLRPIVYGTTDCGGLHAHGVSAPDGTAYLPTALCGVPTVAISEDDGATWEVVTITQQVESRGHEVTMAIDEAGNAYAFWIGPDRAGHLAKSTDAGRTWSEPYQVTPDDLGAAAFPTIAAGAEGRIAVAYIGTVSDRPYSEMEGSVTWTAYLSIVLDAHTEDPVVATMPVHDPDDPIGRGDCGGTRCYASDGGGALGDFIDVVIDGEGRPWAAFVDACTADCREDRQENDYGLGFVGTMSEGPALRGELEPLPALPVEAVDGGPV